MRAMKMIRFSISKVYYPQNATYYACSDSLCRARLKIIYDFDLHLQIKIDIRRVNNINKVSLTKELSLYYIEHNYYINNNKIR